MDLGSKLKDLRLGRNETLHKLAMGTDIDMTLLSKFERGERLPTGEQVKRLAGHFGIDSQQLAVETTAKKIISEYGYNDVTYKALNMVMESFAEYCPDTARSTNG
jgi:transcriptional regulator with XRE-family HTH domain